MVSADIKQYPGYIVKRSEPPPPATQGTQATQASQKPATATQSDEEEEAEEAEVKEEEEEEDEVVAKEDIVKAWRFGSTWVPMEKDTFEPLNTKKGVEVLGFFPRANVSSGFYLVWPKSIGSLLV